jgi:type I restriction enzyme S subunit
VVPFGSILMSCAGELGIVAIAGAEVVVNQQLHVFIPRERIEGRFLLHALSSRKREIENSGTKTAVPYLNKSACNAIPIPLPKPLEQHAISVTLDDADALSGLLEQLLLKKRDLKQAAMQQLLTGQTRLPGFLENWREKALSDLGWTFGGLIGKSKSDFGEGSGRYVTFMNVMTNTSIDCSAFEKVVVKPEESQNRVLKGDLLFNGSSETPEEVALCSIIEEDVPNLFLNSFCFGFRLFQGSEINGLFFAFYLRSRVGRELMKSLAQGSTRYNLSKTALLASRLLFPCLPEQNAIASVLSDMDAELAALEQRLAKIRALKQGMMQELLTGRIRLVKPEAAHA